MTWSGRPEGTKNVVHVYTIQHGISPCTAGKRLVSITIQMVPILGVSSLLRSLPPPPPLSKPPYFQTRKFPVSSSRSLASPNFYPNRRRTSTASQPTHFMLWLLGEGCGGGVNLLLPLFLYLFFFSYQLFPRQDAKSNSLDD